MVEIVYIIEYNSIQLCIDVVVFFIIFLEHFQILTYSNTAHPLLIRMSFWAKNFPSQIELYYIQICKPMLCFDIYTVCASCMFFVQMHIKDMSITNFISCTWRHANLLTSLMTKQILPVH